MNKRKTILKISGLVIGLMLLMTLSSPATGDTQSELDNLTWDYESSGITSTWVHFWSYQITYQDNGVGHDIVSADMVFTPILSSIDEAWYASNGASRLDNIVAKVFAIDGTSVSDPIELLGEVDMDTPSSGDSTGELLTLNEYTEYTHIAIVIYFDVINTWNNWFGSASDTLDGSTQTTFFEIGTNSGGGGCPPEPIIC